MLNVFLCNLIPLTSRLTVISYEEFLENIRQLNEISSRYLDENGKQLVFAVKKGTDSTILWRATVRIACVKLDAATKKIESCRTLSLKQFIVVYNKLRHQADAVVSTDPACCGGAAAATAATAATAAAEGGGAAATQLSINVYEEIEEEVAKDGGSKGKKSGGSGAEECCICLERVPELILPCAHSYCLPCIEQWSVNNKTCPVCRETVDDIDEGWVVSEGPDSVEIATEIQKQLMNLSH